MKMRKAKRLTAIVLAGIMMMSLVGCGKGGSKDGKDSGKKDTADVKNVTFAANELSLEGVQGSLGAISVKGDKIYFTTYEWIEGESADKETGDSSGEDVSEEEGTDNEGVSEEGTTGEDTDKEDTSEEGTDGEEADKEDTSEETTGEETDKEDTSEEGTDGEQEEKEEVVEGTSIIRLYMANEDGTNVKEIPLPELTDQEWIDTPMVNDAGEIILLINCYDDKAGKNTYTLLKQDVSGKEIEKEDITKVLNLEEEEYINKMILDSKDRVVFITEQTVKVLSDDYKSVNEIKSERYLEATAVTKDGKIICGISGEENAQVQVLDVDGGKWGDTYNLDIQYFNSSDALMNGDEDYDFYYSDDKGIYGYNQADKKATKLLDFVASDISSQDIYGLVPINKDTMIGQSWNSQGETGLVKYVKVDPSEVADKTVITFGGTYIGEEVKTAAIQFNKSNSKYRIEFIDYSENEDPDTKMNADIVAGNIPDIIFAESGVMDRYIAKGIMEDLTPYFDKDEELNTSDIIPNVLQAMQVDGKLYYVSYGFTIRTLWGNSDVVGNESGWTFDDFKALLEKQGDSVQAFYYNTKQSLMYSLLAPAIPNYVNWQTGECDLDNQEIKDILEFSNTGIDEEDLDYENMPSMPTMIQEGKVLLCDGYLNLDDLQLYRKMFGGNINFIGYPNKDKEGSFFNIDLPIGISSKSEHKDAAWEFVRTFMTKEYQAINAKWSNPTRQDCLDMLVKAHTTKESYTDEFGQKIEPISGTTGYDDWEVETEPCTDEEIKLYKDLINNTHKARGYDNKIMEIIEEETKAYFAGDKSVDQVVDIIQNRVSTYVNENR